jgi:saccharopine dehydrogenase-like NADP-dependent oxidoreductase
MRVLLLGVGMQGKAALHDLAHSDAVTEIITADREVEELREHAKTMRYPKAIHCHRVDASDPQDLDRLMEQRPSVVIDLLPVSCVGVVTAAAVRHKVHLVNTFYAYPEVREQAAAAQASGVTILPECGLDPGIDVVLLGRAARSLDEIEEIVSYGGGIPEPEAADNPLRYKVSWSFPGVLRSYRRAGRVIRNGTVVDIERNEIFASPNIHELEIEGLGRLEAYPNGDVTEYVHLLSLEPSKLRNAGRYGLRWPGHCAFWKRLVDLHLLDDEPVVVDGIPVDRRRFLSAAVEPHIQYQAHERDIAIARVELRGTIDCQKVTAFFQVVDRRDMSTGHLAMARTVGYTASIGAQMIGTGTIRKRGLLSPVNDVPYEAFSAALEKRGIRIMSRVCPDDVQRGGSQDGKRHLGRS